MGEHSKMHEGPTDVLDTGLRSAALGALASLRPGLAERCQQGQGPEGPGGSRMVGPVNMLVWGSGYAGMAAERTGLNTTWRSRVIHCL